jgi:hypothetical protein
MDGRLNEHGQPLRCMHEPMQLPGANLADKERVRAAAGWLGQRRRAVGVVVAKPDVAHPGPVCAALAKGQRGGWGGVGGLGVGFWGGGKIPPALFWFSAAASSCKAWLQCKALAQV